MNANKALWEKGDFTRLAESMRNSGEAIVAGLGIPSDSKVLDLGCGDGTTAIPAAKYAAQVLGVDIAENLVAAGVRRALFTSQNTSATDTSTRIPATFLRVTVDR